MFVSLSGLRLVGEPPWPLGTLAKRRRRRSRNLFPQFSQLLSSAYSNLLANCSKDLCPIRIILASYLRMYSDSNNLEQIRNNDCTRLNRGKLNCFAELEESR